MMLAIRHHKLRFSTIYNLCSNFKQTSLLEAEINRNNYQLLAYAQQWSSSPETRQKPPVYCKHKTDNRLDGLYVYLDCDVTKQHAIYARSYQVWKHSVQRRKKIRFTYKTPHLCILPSAALSSRTGPPFSLGGSRPSPHTRTLTCAATQHVALVCRY